MITKDLQHIRGKSFVIMKKLPDHGTGRLEWDASGDARPSRVPRGGRLDYWPAG
jgi:hypothetical protein